MFFNFSSRKSEMPDASTALPGRTTPIAVTEPHFVNGRPLTPPYPEGYGKAMFGLGCFWGAERLFWKIPGVYVTAVGYAAGFTPNPTYEEVCSGRTGHNEVVLAVFDPELADFETLLSVFWEGHDPTQGMRQGNDAGTQYRSGIYCYGPDQLKAAEASRKAYAAKLKGARFGDITTEIMEAPTVYFAETYHQQYLGRNPRGYCGLGGTGVRCG